MKSINWLIGGFLQRQDNALFGSFVGSVTFYDCFNWKNGITEYCPRQDSSCLRVRKSRRDFLSALRPENGRISRKPMKSENHSRHRVSSSRTNPTGPAAGNDNRPEVLYGLHAVREALRAGGRPLQRLLVQRTDRQFADLVQQAKAQQIPVHIEPPRAFDRLVPGGNRQGVIAFVS